MVTWLRRQPLLLCLVGVAITVRVAVHVAYPYAFFFNDSRRYVVDAAGWQPNPMRPFGYSLVLKPFILLHVPLTAVTVLQNLMALTLIIAGYAFLLHHGVRPWLATLAMVPLALNPRELLLEQYILSETFFLLVTATAFILLTWRKKLDWRLAACVGALLATAALTKTIGIPLLGLAVVFMVLRRVGWRPVIACLLTSAVFVLGYAIAYHRAHGVYAIGQYEGRFLYGRTMSFADCAELTLTAPERVLCVSQPPAQRAVLPEDWVWRDWSPAQKYYPSVSDDHVLRAFALTAIRDEPVKYGRVVVTESMWEFLPDPPTPAAPPCGYPTWQLPGRPGAPCQAMYYLPTAHLADTPPRTTAPANATASVLSGYAAVQWAGPAYAVCVLVIAFGALWRRRTGVTGIALLFACTGLAIIVISVATSMYDPRYAVPVAFFFPVGAALLADRLVKPRQSETD